MVFDGPETDAQEFIDKIERLFARQDGLIYEFDADVKDPNGISFDALGSKDAWIEIRLFNVGDPNNALDTDGWLRLGEMVGMVDRYNAHHSTDYHSVIEVTKRFD